MERKTSVTLLSLSSYIWSRTNHYFCMVTKNIIH